MRKLSFIVFCFVLLFGCISAAAAETEEKTISVSYNFDDVPDSVLPGETVAVPVYLTIEGSVVNSVLTHMSFDESAFTFQKYKSSTDKGTHGLNFGIVGLTQNNSSVVSGVFVSSDGNTTSEFNNTLLFQLRFTVSEDAQPGEYEFKIVKSQVGCDSVDAENFSSEEYSAGTLRVTVSGDEGVLGDADGDSKITVADACVIMKHIAGIETLADITYVDVDGDGTVTVADATRVLKYIARLINEL